MAIFRYISLSVLGGCLISSVALASVSELVEADISKPIECQIEMGRKNAKIRIGEFQSITQRELRFIGLAGGLKNIINANCEYKLPSYRCRWGRTNQLDILIDQTVKSTFPGKRGQLVLRGKLKADVFRPAALVTCRVDGIRYSGDPKNTLSE